MTILKKSVSLTPGQSKVASFVFTPAEARAYQVSVDGLSGSFIAAAEVIPQITNALWSVVFVEGPLGGYLVKATIGVSSPREFNGKLNISLPGDIAKVTLLNYNEWQAEIAQAQDNLAACEGNEVCIHDRTLHLERVLARPRIDGFYYGGTVKSSYDKYVAAHLDNIATAIDPKTWNITFPQGISTIELAFYIVADQVRYGKPKGESWWEILYWGGIRKYSPTVYLYENTTLLDSVTFDDGIEFIIGEGERIISLDVPPVIESGSEFWASTTLWLPYKPKMIYTFTAQLYRSDGYLGVGDWSSDIIENSFQDANTTLNNKCLPLDHTGEYIARGIRCYKLVCEPAEAVSRERGHPPLPPGTYRVLSTLWWRTFDSVTATSIVGGDDGPVWQNVDSGITVEVV